MRINIMIKSLTLPFTHFFGNLPGNLFSNNSVMCSLLLVLACSGLSNVAFEARAGFRGPEQAPHLTVQRYNQLKAELNPKVLDSGLLGEHIDLDTGSLSFRHVDVDLVGNSNLPVRIARKLDSSQRSVVKRFGWSWSLEIPSITIRLKEGSTWWSERCSNPHGTGLDSIVKHTDPGFLPLTLSIPGEDEGRLLDTYSGETYFGLKTPRLTTLKFSRIECINSENQGGVETFKVTTINGNIYSFDTEFTFPGGRFVKDTYNRYNTDLKILYPSKVEDVHGNSVTYEYSADNKGPLRIFSNDDRQITITYDASAPTQIASVTANDRTWLYERIKSDIADRPDVGYRITRPDGLFWQVGQPFAITWRDKKNCSFVDYLTIKHPNGVEGKFYFTKIVNFRGSAAHQYNGSARQSCLHTYIGAAPSSSIEDVVTIRGGGGWRSNYSDFVDGVHIPRDVVYKIKQDETNNFFSNAVTEKKLLMPDGGEYIWQYIYAEGDEYHTDDTKSFDAFDSERHKMRTVIEPSGRMVKSWVSRAFYRHLSEAELVNLPEGISVNFPEGTVTKREIYETENSLLPISSETYQYEGATRPSVGNTWVTPGIAAIWLNTPNYLTKVTNTLNTGDVYTTNYVTNAYGNNVQVKKSSTDSAAVTTTRTIDTEYEHKTDKWILALPKTISQNTKPIQNNKYNDYGQLKEQKLYGSLSAKLDYDTAGLLISVEDGLKRKTLLKSWKHGTPQHIQQADNTHIYQYVDENGWLESEVNALNQTTTYKRDNMGRITLINPHGNWYNTAIDYDFTGGGLVQTLTTGSLEKTITYDGFIRPVSNKLTDLNTDRTTYQNTEYNSAGQVTFKSQTSFLPDEEKGVNYTFDALGRPLTVSENIAPYASSVYQYLADNTVQVTDPLGNITLNKSQGYGSPTDGELISIVSPESITTTMTYNTLGKLTSVQQSGNQDGYNVDQTHRYDYDDNQRICRHSVPELGDTRYEYDAANQIINVAEGQAVGTSCDSAMSNVVTLDYDLLGRLKNTTFAGSTPNISRTYDANGNLKTLLRGDSAWAYSYFDNNTLKSENLSIDGLQFTTSYTRNLDGNLSGIHYPSSDYVSFTADAFGLPTQVLSTNTDFLTKYANDITYHANNSLEGFTYGNGIEFLQELNDRQLPELRQARFSVADARQDPMGFSYYYDAGSNLTSIYDDIDNSRDVENTYDGMNRLKTSDSARGNMTFIYDAIGNLRKRTVVGGSALGGYQHNMEVSFNSKNQVTSAQTVDGLINYAYDPRGNVKSNGTHGFTYDLANQPITISGAQTGSFTYDGNLKRVRKMVDGKTIYSVYTQGAGLVSQYNESTDTHTDHVRINQTTIARIESEGTFADSSEPAFKPFVVEASEAMPLEDRAHYLPFGKSINGVSVKENAAGYTGHVEDKSGLVYMQARYYDPVIGRFYSNDPASFSNIHNFNRYAYANNNPYKYTDPDGNNAVLRYATPFLKNPSLKTLTRSIRAISNATGLTSPTLNEATDSGCGSCDVPDGDEAVDFNPEEDTLETGSKNRAGEPRIKIKKADGSVVDMTEDRIKKNVPEPRNPNGGDKPHKWKNPQPGSKGKKRDPTPKEKEFIKEHGK